MSIEILMHSVDKSYFTILADSFVPFHVSEIAETIEKETNIKGPNQGFYIQGRRVYRIEPSQLQEPEMYYSVVDMPLDSIEILTFCFDIDENSYSVEVGIENPTKKRIFKALKILSFNTKYSKLFTKEFKMFSSARRISERTRITSLTDFTIRIIYKNSQKLKPFRVKNKQLEELCYFKPTSIVKDVKRYLEFHYATEILDILLHSFPLEDEKTLEENQIVEDSIITIIEGKEEGGFSSLEKLEYIPKNSLVPIWKYVMPGLSWKSTCTNPSCVVKIDYIIVNSGFGTFDFHRTKSKLTCKMCEKPVESLSCGFYKAKWRIVGKRRDKKVDQQDETSGKSYFIYKAHDKVDWTYLNIQVSELK